MEIHHKLPWTLSDLDRIVRSENAVALHDSTRQHIEAGRAYLDRKMAQSNDPVYGINTGFGDLHNTRIAPTDMAQLQVNLVRSHACGAGAPVDPELVRIMLLLKAKGLAFGHSGVQLATVECLLACYNRNLTPVVYEQGSLGASGDLAPLAHLTLGLMGEGELVENGQHFPAADLLQKHGIQPLALGAKEGLALLNGTQFMSAHAAWIALRARRLLDWADVIAALSLDAFDGRVEPFFGPVHDVRPHAGQGHVAGHLRLLLSDSELANRTKSHVQDPYSFRCIPQVHGASRDALGYVEQVVETEINSVTDNPTLFPDEDRIISAGNFHGQPLALALDFAAIALSEIGSISERRTFKLVSGNRGLSPFLSPKPGLNSGFMIPQYTAASLVSRNKGLCTPASVDTIDSSNGQEDHVSMGANAAVKAKQVLENVECILGIELMNACQAIELRLPEKTSPILQHVFESFRKTVPFVDNDVYLRPLMEASVAFIRGTNAPLSAL